MKYRVCWKERHTGKVYRDELYARKGKVDILKNEMSKRYDHLYWIEDETGNYIPEQAEAVLV